MVLSSILAIAWSVGGFAGSNLPYGFDYQMDIVGTTGYMTSAVYGTNDVVYYFDVISRFDLSYLTNDNQEVPTSTSDMAVYFKSVRSTVFYHSNLSDYTESYVVTWNVDTFYDYGEFDMIEDSVLYTEFRNDDVSFDLKYDLGGNTFVWSKENLTTYYDNISCKRGEFPATQFYDAVRSGFSIVSNDSYNAGYADGYSHGFDDGSNQDLVVAGIFTGILEIGLLPINMFLAVLNFDVLGINISSFVSALITIVVVITLVRAFIGNNEGGE